MGFWTMFFVSLAFTVVGELLRPKPKVQNAKPSALGDFQFPTTDATRTIPVFWGTCDLKGPNVTWFGDLKSVVIRKKVKTGLFSSEKVDQGFKYFLGVQAVFGYGLVDELLDFRVDDKSVFGPTAATGSQGGFGPSGIFAGLTPGNSQAVGSVTVTDNGDYWSFVMNSPTILDDGDPTNGVSGPVKLYKGSTTQPANTYLQGVWGEVETSAFRPLCYAVLEQCYMGSSDTPPPISIVARRTPNQLGMTGGKHNIAGDANAACMCYEVMTDLMFGMKIAPTRVDKAAFIACGNTLFSEGMGLSMIIDTQMKGRDLLAEILRHVDGVIYPDPQTGLYTMKLARGDYNPDTLDVFDETNIAPDSFEFSRVSWEDTKNTTNVQYTDRNANFAVLPVQYKDQANVAVRNGQIDSEDVDFLGFSNVVQATRAAARANKTRSAPLSRAQFNTDRRGYKLRPSSVIKVSRPDFNLNNMIMRVVDISYGTLDDPAVKVVCTEDIFSFGTFAYPPPATTGWVPPVRVPTALLYSRLVEIPYGAQGNEDRTVMALGVRNDDTAVAGFDVWSDPAGGTAYLRTSRASGTIAGGTLRATYPASGAMSDATGFVVENVQDEGQVVGSTLAERDAGLSLVMIDNEIMAWQTRTTNGDGSINILNVLRGVFDTLPEDHAAGSVVYFLNDNIPQTAGTAYASDIVLKAKLSTFIGSESAPLAGLPVLTLNTASRAARPNPPGKFRINNLRPHELGAGLSGQFSVSWTHRNKLAVGVVSQDAGDVGPEPGVSYTVEVYNNTTNVLILSRSNIAVSPALVTVGVNATVRVELYSVDADGQKSLYPQKAVFAYSTTGPGAVIGTEAGGSPNAAKTFNAVRLMASINQVLSGLPVIDGSQTNAGDRVLLNAQTDGRQNGLYAVASGAWTRAFDADEGLEFFSGKTVFVTDGFLAGSEWAVTNVGAVSLGTTPITFARVGGGGSAGLGAINAVFDGGGADIAVGSQATVYVPFGFTVLEAIVLGDQNGSLTCDVWADSYGNYPPTVADSITGSNPPKLVVQEKSSDLILTGWAKSQPAGTTLRFTISLCSGVQWATVVLRVRKH